MEQLYKISTDKRLCVFQESQVSPAEVDQHKQCDGEKDGQPSDAEGILYESH